ncbi:MAG: 50S ribosomal protein L6 [Balneolales bacterium]
MSRIGKMPVVLAKGVEFSIDPANRVTVKGAKGELSLQIDPRLKVEKKDDEIFLVRDSEEKKIKSIHGLYRVLISNLVTGVTDGFKKELEVIGVGYRAMVNGNVLELTLGFSHPFFFVPPDGINLDVDTKTSKNARIIISGIDKELVGQVAAKIRSLRPPEPYKGKGVRYVDEFVRKKAGKSAGK